MRQIIQYAPPAGKVPCGPLLDYSDAGICTDSVHVVFTSIGDTLAAVRVAGDFAKMLGVPVTLSHFQSVPYAVPVDQPCGVSPVETEAFIERLQAEGVDVRIRVRLCRDWRTAIPLAFKPHSLIVVAGRRRWWPTAAERWRRMLEAAGHFVVVVDTSKHSKGNVHA